MKKNLYIVDGSSYIYRAFHAMPPLTTSSGRPTGAIKGVSNMMMNLKNENDGSSIVTVFDAKGKHLEAIFILITKPIDLPCQMSSGFN